MADAWNGTCPRCGNEKAYQGFSEWECPNERCSYYTKKQKAMVDEELSQQKKAEKEYLDDCGEYDLGQSDEEDYNKVLDQMYGLWSGGWRAPAAQPPAASKDNSQQPGDDSAGENADSDDIYAYDLPPDMALD